MTETTLQSASTGGWRERWTSLHTAWLLFAPPAVWVGLRWVLDRLDNASTAMPALPLLALSTPDGPLDLIWPVAVALALLLLAGLLLRRLGWCRAMPVVGGVWLLLWLGASAALAQRHLNEQGLFLHESAAPGDAPAPAQNPASNPTLNAPWVSASVLASQFKPPSLRGVGGTDLVLQVPGLAAPHRLLLDDPRARQIRPGDTLALQYARGRFSGLFVVDWRVQARDLSALPAPAASPR